MRETLERSGRQSLIVKDDPETRLAKDRGHNSLFRDYLRLIDAGFEYPVLRVLILVLDLRNAKEENDAGFLLKRIEFERKGEDLFKSESLWVRAWFLHGRKHVRKAA